MAIAFKDRVKTECTTVGTGDIVFGATRHGFQDWSKVPNGETVYYCLLNVDEWEVGYGVKSTGGIQRNVLDSTTGSKISLTGGADVFLTYPADGVIAKDTNGNLILDGTITATSYFGDASTLDNLPTLESLGIENHDQITVDTDGVISGNGGGLTNININLADNGLENHDKITVDELGNLSANSISLDSSLGYPNDWAVTAQPNEFIVSQSGVTKGKIGSDGKMTATGFVGDGSELTGIDSLPTQTGQDGKYLQTDGTSATWQEVAGGGGDATVADGCIYLNNQTITSDYVFPDGKNGMSAGPISVEGSVEVGDGTWTIIGESSSGGSGGDAVAEETIVLQAQQAVVSPEANQPILYTLALEDNTNSYDSTTGKFTVTKAGYYHVMQYCMSDSAVANDPLEINLMKNTQSLVTGYSGIDASYMQNSCSAITKCEVGDTLWVRLNTGAKHSGYDSFNIHYLGTVLSGGSGGGDYTPEALVWEDKRSEREPNIDYTNTNEVPLYIQLAIFTDGNVEDNYCEFIIDGTPMGASGIIGSKSWNNPFYIVPAGSTYRARTAGSTTVSIWHEARMPLAVASGGSGETATLDSLGIPNHDKVTVGEDGRVGIGGVVPHSSLQIKNTNIGTSVDTNVSSLILSNQGGDYTAGSYYGSISFARPNSNGATLGAFISPLMGGTNKVALTFGTDEGSGVAERMRIGSGGQIITSNESNFIDNHNANFCINHSETTRGINLHTTGTGVSERITFQNDNGVVGTINSNGSGCSLNGFTTRASDVYFSDDEENPRQGKSLKETLADRDKLIDKLMARLETLEKKVK